MKRVQVLVLTGGLVLGAALLGRAVADGPATQGQQQPAVTTSPRGPVGEMTAEGARDAAVRHLELYGSGVMFEPTARRTALRRITAAAEQPRVLAETDRAFALAAQALGLDAAGRPRQGALVARLVPVGTDVVSFAPPVARVSVWSTALLGVAGQSSTVPVQESWSTEVVDLVWEGGQWRWKDVAHQDGPAPVGSAQVPADAAALLDAHRAHAGGAHG